MNPIDQAILQDEIRQAPNALFKNRQVGRTETKTVLSAPLVEAEFESESGIKLEEGKKYTVSLDSGDYEAVCKSHSFDGENTFYYLGDIAILWEQFEPTEDSFLVVGNEAFVIAIDKDEGGYIHIQTETIHPIDPKFIPGDYIVDLDALGFTSDALREGVELPAEVGNALKKTASSCGGIVVKLNGLVHRLPNFFSAEGLKEYCIWGGGYFTGEIIWISAHFEPADNYFVLVGTPLMSAASEEKLDV